ncbi:MAG: molybdopterin dinucleotide-binding protein [Methanoregulaceae archaeon]|jgi:formylmethanofuran dehydrogenase subunit D|nr:molybdopterin dinucleotide-binding protein [Methanoregulaceae archaeon]
MTFVLITGRTIIQGSYVERKSHPDYQKEASALHMNPVDMLEHDLEEESTVLVTSDAGKVVLRARQSALLRRGDLFVCLGPYANHLIGPGTRGTGMPDFKITSVTIEPTDEPVPGVAELMRLCGGVPYES